MLLGSLDNEVYFKKVFTNVEVFKAFVKDIVGVDIDIAKVETEKVLERKTSPIRFKMDLFAESLDHRVIVEIQKVDYNTNYNRFMHYFLANLIDQQASSKDYAFSKEIYTIIVITAPYKISEKDGKPIKDDVLLTTLNPHTLGGEVRHLYDHRLVFLNPNYTGEGTPTEILDWMNLIQESIKNPSNPKINLSKPAIRKAAELAELDSVTPEELFEAKIEEERKETAAVLEEFGRTKERWEGIRAALTEGDISQEKIAKIFRVSVEYVAKIASDLFPN